MTRLRWTLTFALALTATIALAACGGDSGGDEDPNEVLQATFSNQESVDSGVFDISVDVSAEGGDNAGSFEASLGGPFESGGDGFPSFDIDAELNLDSSIQDVSGSAGLTSTGDSAFVSFQDTDYEIPAQAFNQFATTFTQLQFETQAQADKQGGNFLSSVGIDPTNWLTDVSNEGDEDVEGDETIHITGKADVPKLVEDIKKIAENAPQAAEQVTPAQLGELDQLGDIIESADFDIFTGKDDDILRKLEASMKLNPPEGSAGAGTPDNVSLNFSVTFSDINEPQEISAPSDAQPLQGLLDQLGVDPSALGQLGSGLGGGASSTPGAAPQAGGSPAPLDDSAAAAYLQCLSEAQGAAAVQECESLRP